MEKKKVYKGQKDYLLKIVYVYYKVIKKTILIIGKITNN